MKQFFLTCLLILNFCNGDNDRFLFDGFSTHQPVLYAAAMATKGPIIEFGCGEGSTDLLHEICAKEQRILITLDDDLAWLTRYSSKYLGEGYEADNTGWHKFYFVPGKKRKQADSPAHWIKFLENFTLLNELTFDVCFIDQSPWLGRYEALKIMKDKARFVIVHDVDYFPDNGIFGKIIKPMVRDRKKGVEGKYDFSDVFSTYQVYYPSKPWPAKTGPPTLLGSNFEQDLPLVDYNKPIIIE